MVDRLDEPTSVSFSCNTESVLMIKVESVPCQVGLEVSSRSEKSSENWATANIGDPTHKSENRVVLRSCFSCIISNLQAAKYSIFEIR